MSTRKSLLLSLSFLCTSTFACGDAANSNPADSSGLTKSPNVSEDPHAGERSPEPFPEGEDGWERPPIDPPGGNGKNGNGSSDDAGEADPGGNGASTGGGWDEGGEEGADSSGDDGWDEGGSTFVSSDASPVAQCDNWTNDCPEGEKCSPSGPSQSMLTANICVPVSGDGQMGEACQHDGWEAATDDCSIGNLCWPSSDEGQNEGETGGDEPFDPGDGLCRAFCTGSPDSPYCPEGQGCQVAFGGVLNICLPIETQAGSSGEASCPEPGEIQSIYMSNDDSNSQASPILARKTIRENGVVSREHIRIHEFLNYYDFNHDLPSDNAVGLNVEMRPTDLENGEFGLLVQAQGRRVIDDRPPFNIVFSLDTSGSMSGEPIEFLKDSVRALAGQMKEGDTISMVTWSNRQTAILDGLKVDGPDDPRLIEKVNAITSGGSTDLHGGLVAAYDLAEKHRIKGGINRVFLVSDGGANTGVTDIELIASHAEDSDDEGIYMVGVGVGSASSYRDDLMDSVTDAGKGSYIFIDNKDEAERMFGLYFMSNVAVTARNVRTRLDLPWYFGIKKFHGEEFSKNPAEVEPQHLAPNDSMNFHQIIQTCDGDGVDLDDKIIASVTYVDPIDGKEKRAKKSVTMGELAKQKAYWLRKADTVVAYAQSLILISYYWENGQREDAIEVAEDMAEWLEKGATALEDREVQEIAQLMAEYAMRLSTRNW